MAFLMHNDECIMMNAISKFFRIYFGINQSLCIMNYELPIKYSATGRVLYKPGYHTV